MDAQDPAAIPETSKGGRPRSLIWVVAAATILVEVLVLGGGSVAGYELSSRWYSPERAVMDYFAAQSGGEVSAMMADATFQQGSNLEFFRQPAIASMMALPQNKDLRNVRVVASHVIDPTTQSVAVSMIWEGNQHNQTYTVRKDNSKFRDLIYRSWRVVVPFVTIHITLPNQPGSIQVDGITPASSDVSTIQAVEGYHSVEMTGNYFYDHASQVVDGVDVSPVAAFAPPVSAGAVAMAAAAVKLAFPLCDPAVWPGCLNHTYSAPNTSERWYVAMPGYGDVFYTTYRVTLVGDPTSDMTLVVPPDAGKATASGTCTITVTVDGSSNYGLAGPWTATLTLDGDRFTADLASNCWVNKA